MLKAQPTPTAFEDWRTPLGTQNFFYKNVIKSDGTNTYVAGATMNTAGNLDILVAKFNSAGHVLWIQQYPGAGNGLDMAADMALTAGWVYITGAVTTSTASPNTDVITARFNINTGVPDWTTIYAGPGGGIDGGKSIVIEPVSASILVTGVTYSTSSVYSDVITLRYNASGVQQWVKTYSHGSGMNDAGVTVKATSGSVNVTTAVQYSTSSFNYKAVTLSYATSNGSMTATNTGTAVTTTSVNTVTDFVMDASANIYIIGTDFVTGQGDNWWVQKLDGTTLVTEWTYTFNGADNLSDIPRSIKVDASSNVYVTGYSTSALHGKDLTVTKLLHSGSLAWTQYINGSANGDDEALDLILDASSNVYVTGYKTAGINNTNYYTAKFNSSGTKQWEIETDGTASLNDKAMNMAFDTLNNIIVTGQSETVPGTFTFLTTKYVQKDVINPTDISSETPSERYWYFQNQGQLRDVRDSLVPTVLYYTDRTNPNITIRKNSMSFNFASVDTLASTNDTLQRVDMELKGASATTKAYPLEEQNFSISYFNGTGRDFPSIHGNKKIITPDIYPNIDLIYSSNGLGIKYYYVIKPGGNIADIQIQFSGASSYSLDPTTNVLSLNTAMHSFSFVRPIAYQLTAANTTVAVTGWTPDWQSNGSTGSYKFGTGAYTSSLTLVIMIDRGVSTSAPSGSNNMLWNTYQGGNSDDAMTDLKVDKYGNIYTLTDTYSSTYYLQPTQSFNTPPVGIEAAQLMKYNKLGARIKQVIVGSSLATGATALAIIKDSTIVMVGRTSGSNLSSPGGGNPTGALTTTVGPSWIMKFNSNLTALTWRTRYPGEILDADAKLNGDLYLAVLSPTAGVQLVNQSGSTNINTTGIIQHSGLVAKFDQNGAPLWASYIGVKTQSSYYGKTSIKVDTAKNEVYLFGMPDDAGDWIGYNNYHTFLHSTPVSTSDAYIKKFNSSDSMIVSTYVGGNKAETFEDAAFLTNGDLCFVGTTTSTDTANVVFNPHDGSYISKVRDNSNGKGWIAKFSSNFTLKWMTLYGDSAKNTDFRAATTDPLHSNLLLAGYTTGMPVIGAGSYYVQGSDNLGSGAFVTFDASNQPTWSTSMGIPSFAEGGIIAAAFNPVNSNWDFAGNSPGTSGYPWVSYPGAYNQDFNESNGHAECSTGRFAAVLPIVGINEIKIKNGSDILLYPNPSNTSTHLYFKKGISGTVKITMCNAMGQIVEVRSLNNIQDDTTITFHTSGLTEGVYFMNISSEKISQSIKFVNFN